MSSNDNDFFDGLFDFNGDGKTDLGEEWLAFQTLNESSQNDKLSNKSPTVTPQMNSLIPDTPPKINSKYELKKYKIECITSLVIGTIVSIIFMIFPCAIIWAALDSYDPSNSASGLVTSMFVIGGLFIIGILIFVLLKDIKKYYNQLSAIKDQIDNKK